MTSNNVIKLMIVDDHVLLREALIDLLGKFNEFRFIGSFSNGKELVDALSAGITPDIIVLDLNMPVMDGYETAAILKDSYSQIKILVLTMYGSEVALIRLLQTGVRGFLNKDIHPDDFRSAILSVANNGYYYSNSITGKLASFFYKNSQGNSLLEKGLLNEKEISFLKLACSDLTYKEIAHQLNMTARAIDGYRDGLFEKLDVKSRVGLAIYALRNGLVVF